MIEYFLTILSVLLLQPITLTFVILKHSNPYHFVKNWLLNVIDSPKSPLACQWIIKYIYQYSRIWEWSNQLTLRTRNSIHNELQRWGIQVKFYTQNTQGKQDVFILSFQNILSNILWRATMNFDKKFISAHINLKPFSLTFSKKILWHLY